MSEIKQESLQRAKLNFDLEDDDSVVAPLSREIVTKKIEEVSQKAGFLAKSPKVKEQQKKTQTLPEPIPSHLHRRARKRASTGRTMPFNTRMRPERYDEICEFSDRYSEEEGRPIGMAEVLERAMDALKAQEMKDKSM